MGNSCLSNVTLQVTITKHVQQQTAKEIFFENVTIAGRFFEFHPIISTFFFRLLVTKDTFPICQALNSPNVSDGPFKLDILLKRHKNVTFIQILC